MFGISWSHLETNSPKVGVVDLEGIVEERSGDFMSRIVNVQSVLARDSQRWVGILGEEVAVEVYLKCGCDRILGESLI